MKLKELLDKVYRNDLVLITTKVNSFITPSKEKEHIICDYCDLILNSWELYSEYKNCEVKAIGSNRNIDEKGLEIVIESPENMRFLTDQEIDELYENFDEYMGLARAED